MGSATILKDEYEQTQKDKNLFTEEDLEKNMLQDINSMPFEVDFFIPIVKVTCGDVFAGLLTSEGQVFTWGHNQYGQLGIDKENVLV